MIKLYDEAVICFISYIFLSFFENYVLKHNKNHSFCTARISYGNSILMFDAAFETVWRNVSTSFCELVNISKRRETRENYTAIATNGHF